MATLTEPKTAVAGAYWAVSTEMLNKFNEMAKAAAAATPPVTLTLTDGYISRYELIRQLTKKYNIEDQTLKENVVTTTKNASVTPEQWKALEDYFKSGNRDNAMKTALQARYKYVCHPYLTDGGIFIGDLPGATDEDVRRTGTCVKIGPSLNSNWEAAQWMIQNSHTYGFFFMGSDPDLYLFAPGKTMPSIVLEKLTKGELNFQTIWIYYAAKGGVFNGIFGNGSDQAIINEIESKKGKLNEWDSITQKLTEKAKGTPSKGREWAACDAVTRGAGWLLTAERW